MKILLIDDDPIVILLQRKLMEKAGLIDAVHAFNNGEEALIYLKENEEADKDYLIFLDINMPGLTGWQVLDKLNTLHLEASISVIIITSSIEQAEKDKSKEYALVTDFWVKPFNIESFRTLKDRKGLDVFFKT